MIKYMSGEELAQLIKSDKKPHKDYLVVDVRDDDWAGGNIVGAPNYPSQTFYVRVHELVERTRGVPKVIFHCALSQSRGPKAASIYEETRKNARKKSEDYPQEVFVLQGGFSQFQTKFKDDPLLVENWDKDVWSDWDL